MEKTRQLARAFRAALLLLIAAMAVAPLAAQEPDGAEGSAEPSAEVADRFDDLIEAVARQRDEVTAIANQIGTTDGVPAEILQRRLDQERIDLVEKGLGFAAAVRDQVAAGPVDGSYQQTAIEILQANLPIAGETWDSLAAGTEYPDAGLSAADQAARNRAFYETQRTINQIAALTGDSIELAEELGSPQPAARAAFEERLRERAINASIFLDMAQESAAAARASSNAVPDDTEMSARVGVATTLVSRTASLFGNVVSELEELGDDTASYRQQIITATGEITPDAFNVSVIGELVSQWGQSALSVLGQHGPTMLFRAFVFLIIVFAFYKLSRVTHAVVERGVNRSNASLSQLLRRMFVSVAANLVLAVGLLIALSQLGISLGPLLAGLGIAGFIVGFALQDALANFASGLMILFYRPYDVGDIVEVGGVLGKVDQMSLVNTTVNTFDNQRIIVPNSMIWGNTIKNVTAETVRRVDMVFGISYSDDIVKTEELLKAIVAEHELVLADPEPVVRLHELADSSVNFVVRPWTETVNYWNVYWDITRSVKLRFDESGISIPFPQRDVHLLAPAPGADSKSETAGSPPPDEMAMNIKVSGTAS
jgi:small conductance mechanosensitive channel